MQRNRALLREIENTNQPSFIPADVLRVHKSIAQEIKFRATNQNTHDIDSAMNSMHNTHRYYSKKKQDICMDLYIVNVMNENYKWTFYFISGH